MYRYCVNKFVRHSEVRLVVNAPTTVVSSQCHWHRYVAAVVFLVVYRVVLTVTVVAAAVVLTSSGHHRRRRLTVIARLSLLPVT